MSAAIGGVRFARGASLAFVIIAVLVLFWPAALSLARLWSDYDRQTYSHGMLIAGISVWMLWRKRELAARPETVPLPRTWMFAAWVLLVALVIAWQVSYRAGLEVATQVFLLPLMWLSVLLVLGRHAARAALVPISFLVFALSVWEYFIPYAQALTVFVVQGMLRVTDIPVYFNGNMVQIPSGVFEIAEGCSGLHFIIVALALSCVMGEVRNDNWWMRLRWCALGLGIALLCNWVRVLIIIVSGHVTHMQGYLVKQSHYGFGWAVFAVGVLALCLVERRTPLSPVVETDVTVARVSYRPGWRTVACIALLALPAIENLVIDLRLEGQPALQADAMESRAGWTPEAIQESTWQPSLRNADAQRHLRYVRGDARVELLIADYREQRVGKKLGGYANRLQGEATVVDIGTEEAGGRTFASAVLEQDRRKSLLWSIYRVDGREFPTALAAQLWYSAQAIRTARSPGSQVLALWTPCEPDCAAAHASLLNFSTEMKEVL